jgi:5'-deoxynucleotidase YfbR-like HD superfamily hydrolase
MDEVGELLQELSYFPGREEGLRKIKRYHIYKTLFYRSSDFSHSKRVAWLVQSISPTVSNILKDSFDSKRALALALTHDDAELVTGDHQAGNKMKMTPAQLTALADEERDAIGRLVSSFPSRVGGYSYAELLADILDVESPEAQVVKYADRLDAMGEALHELHAGNTCMNTNVTTEYGLITLPFQSYYETLPKMIEKYRALTALKGLHVFFSVPEQRDWDAVVKQGKLHNKESLSIPTGHPQYDQWKKIILEYGDSQEIRNLYTQVEFL